LSPIRATLTSMASPKGVDNRADLQVCETNSVTV
jgi:hypothetical protein